MNDGVTAYAVKAGHSIAAIVETRAGASAWAAILSREDGLGRDWGVERGEAVDEDVVETFDWSAGTARRDPALGQGVDVDEASDELLQDMADEGTEGSA